MKSNNYQSLLQKVEEEHEQSTKESLNINSRVLLVDGLNTFIRAFAANPAINDDGVHIGGLIGFLKSLRYTISILKPTRCIIAFDVPSIDLKVFFIRWVRACVSTWGNTFSGMIFLLIKERTNSNSIFDAEGKPISISLKPISTSKENILNF